MLNADLRRRLVELAYHWQAGHIPSALSVVDIIEALYSGVMRYRPHDPAWPDRDYFILSKGHGALALYAVLEKHGILSLDLAKPLPEHPEMGIPGVEAATGSLGHGLPMAVGIALGLRIQGRPNRVFCLVGDGECNEGSIWEAALVAAHLQLDNLICIIDDNHSSLLPMHSLEKKWCAFRWDVSLAMGHSADSLGYALEDIPTPPLSHPPLVAGARPWPQWPVCIIAETTKGKSVARMENNPQWHHRVPTDEEYVAIMKEIA